MSTLRLTIDNLPADLTEEDLRAALRQGMAGLMTQAQTAIRRAADTMAEQQIAAVTTALEAALVEGGYAVSVRPVAPETAERVTAELAVLRRPRAAARRRPHGE